jgi:hypothetical protein
MPTLSVQRLTRPAALSPKQMRVDLLVTSPSMLIDTGRRAANDRPNHFALPHRREAGRRLFRRGLGEAGCREFYCERGNESAERFGVETDFRFQEGRAAQWGGFTLDVGNSETCCYILMVRGSVSLKLSADSAGRMISFSPV